LKFLKRVLGLQRSYEPEVVFLSFPKSGRTWHRVLLGSYLAMYTQQPMRKALEINELTRRAGGRYSWYTHNAANFDNGLACDDPKVADPAAWEGRDVLLILRDPRDLLVSAFHHNKFRQKSYDGTVSEFVRDPVRGIDKVLTAWNRWNDNQHRARTFTVQRYEDMLSDTSSVIRKTIELIGVPVKEELISRAVDFGSFSNMKKYEQQNFFGDSSMRNRRGNPEAAKVRQGGAGGYKAHLAVDDLDYIAARSELIGNPFKSLWEGHTPGPSK